MPTVTELADFQFGVMHGHDQNGARAKVIVLTHKISGDVVKVTLVGEELAEFEKYWHAGLELPAPTMPAPKGPNGGPSGRHH